MSHIQDEVSLSQLQRDRLVVLVVICNRASRQHHVPAWKLNNLVKIGLGHYSGISAVVTSIVGNQAQKHL